LILLYQPYYHRKGHFSHFLHLYYTKIQANGWPCKAVLGVQEDCESALVENPDFHLFKNNAGNRKLEILNNIKGLNVVAGLLKKQSIHAIHFLDMEPVLLAFFCSRYSRLLSGIRIVIHQHSVNHYNNPKTPLKKIYALLVKLAFRQLEQYDLKVTTNGPFISDFLKEHKYVSRNTLLTSSWGHEEIDGLKTDQKQPATFLFPGIIRRDKNPEYLLESFKHVTEPCYLIIAGFPKDYTKAELYEMAKTLEHTPVQVQWKLGYLTNFALDRLYRRSQFVVLPYHESNKSSSGPLMAALQYECIPIISNYGERGRLVTDNGFGYSFTFQDEKLSNIIMNVLKNPQKNRRFVDNIHQKKHKFTWDYIIDDLLTRKSLYEPGT